MTDRLQRCAQCPPPLQIQRYCPTASLTSSTAAMNGLFIPDKNLMGPHFLDSMRHRGGQSRAPASDARPTDQIGPWTLGVERYSRWFPARRTAVSVTDGNRSAVAAPIRAVAARARAQRRGYPAAAVTVSTGAPGTQTLRRAGNFAGPRMPGDVRHVGAEQNRQPASGRGNGGFQFRQPRQLETQARSPPGGSPNSFDSDDLFRRSDTRTPGFVEASDSSVAGARSDLFDSPCSNRVATRSIVLFASATSLAGNLQADLQPRISK